MPKSAPQSAGPPSPWTASQRPSNSSNNQPCSVTQTFNFESMILRSLQSGTSFELQRRPTLVAQFTELPSSARWRGATSINFTVWIRSWNLIFHAWLISFVTQLNFYSTLFHFLAVGFLPLNLVSVFGRIFCSDSISFIKITSSNVNLLFPTNSKCNFKQLWPFCRM